MINQDLEIITVENPTGEITAFFKNYPGFVVQVSNKEEAKKELKKIFLTHFSILIDNAEIIEKKYESL